MPLHKGWIGVDLDGTLAVYDHWRGFLHIGEPVGPMVERVKHWCNSGKTVKIFTARCAICEGKDESVVAESILAIKTWCRQHIGRELEVTNIKDQGMIELWDDRAVQVEKNTGRVIL